MRFTLPPHIPVRITFGFWIVAAVIGFLWSMSLVGSLIWIAIIFVSVLVHEYGHAITSAIFGQHPRIELVPFGGVTFPEGKKIEKWQEFIVVFNGPLFGFGLFVLGYLVLKIPAIASAPFASVITVFRNVNLFWTIVNLLPVMPLDGGQLLRIVCQAIFKSNGIKISLLISLGISTALSLFSFLTGYFLVGAIFILFAFQNFEAYRQMRSMTRADEDEEAQELLKSAENAINDNRLDEAEPTLAALYKRTKKGMIFNAASQYLAKIIYQRQDFHKAYALLKPIRKDLVFESLLILHEVAFEVKDYRTTLELAGLCFQQTQDPKVALRSAKAAAHMRKKQPALGWLQAAKKAGLENYDEIAKDPLFKELLK